MSTRGASSKAYGSSQPRWRAPTSRAASRHWARASECRVLNLASKAGLIAAGLAAAVRQHRLLWRQCSCAAARHEASMDETAQRDAVIRQAAFDHVRQLIAREGIVDSDVIAQGFRFEGRR